MGDHSLLAPAVVEKVAVEVVLPVLTLVLGAILAVMAEAFFKRPKLMVVGCGGGGGPGPGFCTNHLRISNAPGLFGIRLNETKVFGKKIHGRIEKGLSIERQTANDCHAWMHDAMSGEVVSHLSWRSVEDPTKLSTTTAIRSGHSVELLLFARLSLEPSKYFVYRPLNESSSEPQMPELETGKFSDSRDFEESASATHMDDRN
jgi:hypothetical protein